MKRKFLLLFMLMMMLTVAVHAADTKTVHIEELGVSIDVPSKTPVITQDSASYATADKDWLSETQQSMKEKNVYLLLQNDDSSRYRCQLVALPFALERIDLFDDTVLERLLELQASTFAERGMSVSSATVFRTDHAVFFRIEFSDKAAEGRKVQGIAYYTVHNYQLLGFMQRYEGEISKNFREHGERIINTLRFDPDPDAEPVQGSTEFRDNVSGAGFTVPEGWTPVGVNVDAKSFTGHPSLSDSYFIRSDDETYMEYQCVDMMAWLPNLFDKLLPREEIDQDDIYIDVVKRWIGHVRSAKTQTIGGRDYYVLEHEEKDELWGEYEATSVVFIQNGCAYLLRFSGTADHPRYADFLSVVETAEFPEYMPAEEETQNAGTHAKPAPGGNGNSGLSYRLGFIAGRIAVLLVIVGIVIAVAARNRKKRSARTAVPVAPVKRACAGCGAELDQNEHECPYCGTKAK